MYLFELRYSNALRNHSGSLKLGSGQSTSKKWSLFNADDTEKGLELLQLTALAGCGCAEHLEQLPYDLTSLIYDQTQPLQLELIWAEHKVRKSVVTENSQVQSGLGITPQGEGKRLLKKEKRLIHNEIPYSRFSKWNPPAKHPLFAYGSAPLAHAGSDDFDFTDPFYQLRRIHSLFNKKARLTDPIAFLSNLHYRAVQHRRYMPLQILKNIQNAIKQHLHIDTSEWMKKNVDFSQLWSRIAPRHRLLMLPALDAARHLHDALPSCANPLNFPGIMLLYRPDRYCPPEYLNDWTNLLDKLFPAMQFIVAAPASLHGCWPESFLSKKLPHFPVNPKVTESPQFFTETHPLSAVTAQLSISTILLVDVDSTLPNLALMKLAGYYKQQGYHVKLVKKAAYEPEIEAVFASSIFNYPSSLKKLEKMQAYYGDKFHCGGSGIDIRKRLPREVEETEPDYNLYPGYHDRAIGFLTRGCPFKCPFCLVPIKEGKPRQVDDLNTLTGPNRDKLILLDDNLLAHPNSHQLLEEIASKNLRVNFNQTLDLNLVNKDKARLIKKIPCSNVKFSRIVYHFSLNDTRNLPEIRKKYELFNFESRDNVEFICMYGFNTTLAQDLERFLFLRSLPGAYVFVQEYKPISCGPKPQLDNYFPEKPQADRYIDQLIGICFTQNMKSMEKYYRWLSRFYAERFGTLHMGLVDTIFRYNNRFNRGRYIAELAGIKNDK
ncbi:MAG: hypothetical protein R6U91_09965 [Bacillota bacterium]